MRFLVYDNLAVGKRRESFERVRAAIERDDLRAADVKKLHVGPFHRAKLGYSDRLLLQFVEHEGATACVALEIIENHAYDRSRFLRGARIDEAKIETGPEGIIEPSAISYLHPSRATVSILDKILSFDDTQDAVLRQRCPILLVGSAGSGKTALTLEKMRSLPGDVLYVTQSAFLATSARAMYFAHGFEATNQEAEFLSYREFLESIHVPQGRAVVFADFKPWFSRHREMARFTDAHQAFEEIHGVLTSQIEGALTRAAYLELGPRQSIFARDQRERVYDLFEKYREWLRGAGLFEPNAVAHGHLALVTPRYDFAVVDEVQDLTTVELALVLRTLRTRGQFLLTGDANQIVHPNFFSWSAVKSLFWRDPSVAAQQTLSVLDVNYRNAASVTRVANTLLKIKHARFGSVDKESNALIRPVAVDEGEVVGISSRGGAVSTLDEKTRRSTRFAVIVLRDEDKVAARERFRTPLLFSIHEAKGLEYENVILFEMVSRERDAYRDVSEGITLADLAVTELTFRRTKEKSDKSLEVYKFFVNALYVALTRATRRVYVVESEVEHPLLSLLGVGFGPAKTEVAAAASTIDEWQCEARRLELQGKREQADAIRNDILRVAPVPWKVLDESGYRELADKAFAPRSVFAKAKQRLFDYACFHEDARLAARLAEEASFPQASSFKAQSPAVAKRYLAPYEARGLKDVLGQTERYGTDFRSAMNQTPLALAARAGNVALVEALLSRGANRDVTDQFGRSPVHWAVRRAYEDVDFAQGPFAALYELLAPVSLDVQVDERLFKIGRHQGEYFFLLATVALFKSLFHDRFGRFEGLSSALFTGGAFKHFPENVIRAERRKRTYVNQILARNEPGSAYCPNRKLWIRERMGSYVPNPSVALRVDSSDGARFCPIGEVLGLALLDEHLESTVPARYRAQGLSKAQRAT